ncbi:MAG: penicillin-binding protein 2 [Proteobacteria bacterium]|nr:penicillin-binding protein 2 [Pseudomonadota bacterium]
MPHGETVRVTSPDLRRRRAIEKSRGRLVVVSSVFLLLFLAVAAKLADATLIDPMKPAPRVVQQFVPNAPPPAIAGPPVRASILDANGQILAVSLPVANLYADPRQMIDTGAVAAELKKVLPDINEADIARRLASSKAFVYIARQVTPGQEIAINNLGIPGLSFQTAYERRYPLGNTAAQVLGGVDIDGNGIAGVEKYFNKRLNTDPSPLRLSIDVRVQAILRQEVANAVKTYTAIGGCGIVEDANSGRVLGMVSIPDYDANDLATATDAERFNRCATGTYEPGSVFKLQTASMALDDNVVHMWDYFNTTHPIPIGRFHITDFEPQHQWMQLADIMRLSSNIGASRIAVLIGKQRQREWLKKLGLMTREPIQLPESAMPQLHPGSNWGLATLMTVSFGNGIAVTPLHIANTAVAVVNGGLLYQPTLLAQDPGDPAPQGVRVMQESTSDMMRRIMRLIVTNGTGNFGEVPGYFVGAKTGTSQKVSSKGGYKQHTNYSSFVAAFPIYAPRYVVYIAIDSGHATAATHGFTTGGYMAAPAVAHVIARIGPMLNVMPRFDNVAAINQELSLPKPYPAPPGVVPLGPNNPGEPDNVAAAARAERDQRTSRREAHHEPAKVAAGAGWAAPAENEKLLRHDAMYRVAAPSSHAAH